jgi:hypothetical protein
MSKEKNLESLLKKVASKNETISDQADYEIEQIFEKNKEDFFILLLKVFQSTKDKKVKTLIKTRWMNPSQIIFLE